MLLSPNKNENPKVEFKSKRGTFYSHDLRTQSHRAIKNHSTRRRINKRAFLTKEVASYYRRTEINFFQSRRSPVGWRHWDALFSLYVFNTCFFFSYIFQYFPLSLNHSEGGQEIQKYIKKLKEKQTSLYSQCLMGLRTCFPRASGHSIGKIDG